jgi:hypothetical protein
MLENKSALRPHPNDGLITLSPKVVNNICFMLLAKMSGGVSADGNPSDLFMNGKWTPRGFGSLTKDFPGAAIFIPVIGPQALLFASGDLASAGSNRRSAPARNLFLEAFHSL